jgi:threonylcarbamoyladenosine tRNA methylthiotransferase MtaB
LMPHMHLPIQSGSDAVLRRMARRCKTAEFERLVDRARSRVELFNVTTDLITGFPGETEQEWDQTVKFVEKLGFGHMHIFTFSARAGTKAARLPDQIEQATKKMRSREMHLLAARLKQQELNKHIGRSARVLWEQQISDSGGQWVGYTPHYHKITAFDSSIQAATIGDVSIDSVSSDGLMLQHQLSQHSVAVDDLAQYVSRG